MRKNTWPLTNHTQIVHNGWQNVIVDGFRETRYQTSVKF